MKTVDFTIRTVPLRLEKDVREALAEKLDCPVGDVPAHTVKEVEPIEFDEEVEGDPECYIRVEFEQDLPEGM